MKLSTELENFKDVVSDDLSFAAVEIDKHYWLALPRWRNLCGRLSCDQPQNGSFFQRPKEAKKRDPGKMLFENRFGLTYIWKLIQPRSRCYSMLIG